MPQDETASADPKASDDTAPVVLSEPKPDTKPKAPAKPQRVKLRNTKAANGTVGAIATPLQKDADAWLAEGWVKA